MSPKSRDKYPCKKKQKRMFSGNGTAKTEAANRVMQPQAQGAGSASVARGPKGGTGPRCLPRE